MSSKGQVVIPKEFRELAGLKPGDVMLFRMDGKIITLEKIDDTPVSMITLLKRGKPFEDGLLDTLRGEWD